MLENTLGYTLYREVKERAPTSLTHREKLTAMILADDANDETRLTWSSVVDPEILRQAMVKNERDMRKVLARLQEEGVIERVGGGGNGRVAKYRFLRLAQSEGEHVGGPDRTGYADEPGDAPVQKEPPTDGVGGPNRHRRRSKSNPPTPLSPQNPPPSPPPSAPVPPEEPPVTDGREGGGIATLNNQTQAAYDALTRITTTTPQLGLGEPELLRLAPLVVPWLARTTETQLREALTAGLPAQVGSPVGLLRSRLLEKLPPAAPTAAPTGAANGLPEWCQKCAGGMDLGEPVQPAARFNPRFRMLDGRPCPNCHPDAVAA